MAANGILCPRQGIIARGRRSSGPRVLEVSALVRVDREAMGWMSGELSVSTWATEAVRIQSTRSLHLRGYRREGQLRRLKVVMLIVPSRWIISFTRATHSTQSEPDTGKRTCEKVVLGCVNVGLLARVVMYGRWRLPTTMSYADRVPYGGKKRSDEDG
ncbi:hypothetical protein BDZ89DRAFT_1066302 [Hymenopellis radicata]|nr:hypothetical protein BDZ89DRAFT_1066302 [Hymenopellis radicata]